MADSDRNVLIRGYEYETELRRALVTLSPRGGGTLILAAEMRPGPRFVEALVEALAAQPSIDHIDLVHPSTTLSFLASAVRLRLRGVTVRAHRELPTEAGRAPRAESGERRRYGTVTLAGDADRAAIQKGLDRVWALPRVVLMFDGPRPERAMIDHLAGAIGAMPSIEQVILVHACPSIGFFTSGLSLLLPHVEVRAFRSIDELDAAVG